MGVSKRSRSRHSHHEGSSRDAARRTSKRPVEMTRRNPLVSKSVRAIYASPRPDARREAGFFRSFRSRTVTVRALPAEFRPEAPCCDPWSSSFATRMKHDPMSRPSTKSTQRLRSARGAMLLVLVLSAGWMSTAVHGHALAPQETAIADHSRASSSSELCSICRISSASAVFVPALGLPEPLTADAASSPVYPPPTLAPELQPSSPRAPPHS